MRCERDGGSGRKRWHERENACVVGVDLSGILFSTLRLRREVSADTCYPRLGIGSREERRVS